MKKMSRQEFLQRYERCQGTLKGQGVGGFIGALTFCGFLVAAPHLFGMAGVWFFGLSIVFVPFLLAYVSNRFNWNAFNDAGLICPACDRPLQQTAAVTTGRCARCGEPVVELER
jgi:hypothetical protein